MAKKRKSNIMFLLVAVVCGLVAAFLVGMMLLSYTRTVDVCIMNQDIGPYERIDSSMISVISMPAAAVSSDAILKVEEVDGKFTKYGLARETVIRQIHIADSDLTKGGPLASVLTNTEDPDKRAFALPLDLVISVGGSIGKEDRIDIIASLNVASGTVTEPTTKIIARNVRVLDVITGGDGFASIVIVVTPEMAEELVYLLENGKVYAVLNPYEPDVKAADTDGFYTAEKFLSRHTGSFEVPDFYYEDEGDDESEEVDDDTEVEGGEQ